MRNNFLRTFLILSAFSFSFFSYKDKCSVSAIDNVKKAETTSEAVHEKNVTASEMNCEGTATTSEAVLEKTVTAPETVLEETVTASETAYEKTVTTAETAYKETVAATETTYEETAAAAETIYEETVTTAETTYEETVTTTSEEVFEEILLGDVNCDGIINSYDMQSFELLLLSEDNELSDEELKAYDLDGSGIVDVYDIVIFKLILYTSITYNDIGDIEAAETDYAAASETEERTISITEAKLREAAAKGDPFPVEVYIEDDRTNNPLNVLNDHNFSAAVQSIKYENNSNRYATVFETWEDENTKELWGKISLDRIESPKWICMIRAEESGDLTTLVKIPSRNIQYTLPDPDSYEYKLLVNAVYKEANGVNYRCDETTQLICKAAIVAEILNRVESNVYPNTIESVLRNGFSGASSYTGQNAYSFYDRNKSQNPQTFAAVENSVRYFFDHQDDFSYYLYNHGLWAERRVNENYFSYDYHYYFDLTAPTNRDIFLYY